MNDNDEQQSTAMNGGNVDAPEGLGHDPLEWLQDDEEILADSSSAERSNAEPAAESEHGSETVIAESDKTADLIVKAEAAPEPEAAETMADAASDNQSFTYDNHKAILTLPEKLTVQIIEPLHSEWKTLLYDLPQSLEIDASKVEDIDAAGMQLFYALVQQMVFKGSDVVILNVQPALQRYFELFGLQDFFSQYTHAA